MEVDVSAGVALDLASKSDLRRMLDALKPPYIKRISFGANGASDANGNLNLRVYDIPDGKTFFLYKMICWADGYTPASGFSSANAWLGIYHGAQASAANLADFAPSSSGTQLFPGTFEYNSHTAPEFRQNDNLFVSVVAGPPSKNLSFLCFGELEDLRVKAKTILPEVI